MDIHADFDVSPRTRPKRPTWENKSGIALFFRMVEGYSPGSIAYAAGDIPLSNRAEIRPRLLTGGKRVL